MVGYENLYLILDGHDQELPQGSGAYKQHQDSGAEAEQGKRRQKPD
ncbi:MAG: hypothetical protein MZV63_48275 [Marinilabiliales bacterium]|nr:hypothetical protein [Marinilabiliales bacterium]